MAGDIKSDLPVDSLHPELLPQERYLAEQEHPEHLLMPEGPESPIPFLEVVGEPAMQGGYPILIFKCPYCKRKMAAADYGRVLHPLCHRVCRVVPKKQT